MRLIVVPILLMTLLTGCNLGAPKYVHYTLECVWFKPVHLSDETKTRLKAGGRHGGIEKDVKNIKANNDKFSAICN